MLLFLSPLPLSLKAMKKCLWVRIKKYRKEKRTGKSALMKNKVSYWRDTDKESNKSAATAELTVLWER